MECDKRPKILERKAEGKHEGKHKDKESRINSSSSRASQAEVIEGGKESLADKNEPSVYIVCTERGKTSSSSILEVEGEE
ncbi:hypothetical protein RIR_jg37395.t1 [Rhizophagus irregularis DAOM 181602=DAOM 197198]|nr:hypothetical protein RIR_jg37395.t1 [Rhizophagus irregularis DAOM 181602=DAOM 197198]